MDHLLDPSKWPLIYQLLAALGATLAGAYIYLRAPKGLPTSEAAGQYATQVDLRNAIIDFGTQETARNASIDKKLNDQESEFKSKHKEIEDRLAEYSHRLREAEQKVGILWDRDERGRGRRPSS